ncbi:carbon starvation protein [Dethiosulfatibacter aminovorans DSM 17477]|uniref:Carbon starvation protein n=1 Tax=Dethiosulfatibacter aminovorans DSM 17477 TaxID=1121476 RepID=A0A1M6EA62_9FIRM|nr:carbon starvation protein A [Dethiosulfatibacter aminovorans]SHI82240.1 carbon starvation protein [Dethiosulfatibacter aminovorans DSM 17477]
MSLFLVLIAIVIFLIAYVTYGAWLSKKWGVDLSKTTPAHELADGVDYVPAKAPVLLGHHFASIAGAGPIVGPIAAAMFGWLPVFLWIIVGSIFFGGVHDYGSLFASVRHEGKSVGHIIEKNVGESGKKLFSIFAWLTLLLVIAAFANVIVKTFVAVPAVATTSLLFIILAIAFGFSVNRMNVPLGMATVVGVVLLIGCIWFGLNNPIVLSFNAWYVITLVYIFIASVAPVWILLQPRDYLNSYLLYAMIGGAVLGLIVYRPGLELPAVTGFNVNGSLMFPILFVTVACGAISGFHSLVSSGTTSKQVDREGDTKLIGYGSMLIEGVLAVIALITAGYIGADKLAELASAGGATNVFADGVGQFMTGFGLAKDVGKSFVALAISAFALTSLDTGTRIGRFIFQEFFDNSDSATGKESNALLTNKFFATLVTVALGGLLGVAGYTKVWPIFGSANQLLAAIALMTVATWLKNQGKDYKMFSIPMVFMFVVTFFALILLVKSNIASGNYILVVIGAILFVLAIVLAKQSWSVLTSKSPVDRTGSKAN